MDVGDSVEYMPHICHAYNGNQNNEYPWVIGQKRNPHYETDPKTGEKVLVEDIVELDEGHLHRNVLPLISRAPDIREERKKLVPVRPKNPWPAVVRSINDDGTVDLDIVSNVGVGMVTLHYNRVPVDVDGKIPHSCRPTS